jgi:hypothetical protein
MNERKRLRVYSFGSSAHWAAISALTMASKERRLAFVSEDVDYVESAYDETSKTWF